MIRKLVIIAALLAALASLAAAPAAMAARGKSVAAHSSRFGTVLTDGRGRRA
jgi:hypothetical protein